MVPVKEPGADPADVAGVPSPEALARAAQGLQVEAARWARLRVGEELVYEWPLAVPAEVMHALQLTSRRRVEVRRNRSRNNARRTTC